MSKSLVGGEGGMLLSHILQMFGPTAHLKLQDSSHVC